MTITTRASFMSARLCTLVLGTAVFAVAMASAHGQTSYPVKPIRLLVPFPPGGGTDMIARSVAQKITEKTSWTIAQVRAVIWVLTLPPKQRQTGTPW